MYTDRQESKESKIVSDYLRGYVAPRITNSIHCHDEYEFMLIVSGEITYSDNRGSIKMTDKSLVFTKAHDVHNPSVSNDKLYERYKIEFNAQALDGLPFDDEIRDLLSNSYKKRLSDEDFCELIIYFKGLYESIKKGDSTPMRERLYLLSALSKGKSAQSEERENEDIYIKDVIEYIKANYNSHLTIYTLASLFFVSRGKLIYDFKAYAGMNLFEYITLTRLEAAKEMLLSGYSVTAAAENCGFSSPSYFIKVFSGVVGQTPLKFQTNYLRKH